MQHPYGAWRGGGRSGPPGYAPGPLQHDYGLLQRLQQVVDTRDAVTGCSRTMLQHSDGRDNRARAIRQWKDVVEGVIHDKVVSKALALLYVINDILQCPHHGYSWQEDLGPHLCDVLPKALACARALRAYEIHQKMTRMPSIWHERRVLPSNIAERLVDYCYDSTQELEHGPMPSHAPRPNSTPAPLPPSSHPAPPLVQASQPTVHHLPHSQNPPPAQVAAHHHPPPYGHGSHALPPALCNATQAHMSTLAPPTMSAQLSSSSAVQTLITQVAPDPKQVELEQARFDIDEAISLLGLVKKTVLERKLQIFEQTHADAKLALESSQAAALSSALHRDAQRLRDVFQEETANFEAQHEQQAEHLRVAWVLELKVWGDSVVMLRNRLHQKTPDARWLSDLLRKAHRAQRCYETAVELETFLTNFCVDPEQPLLPDIWSKPASCTGGGQEQLTANVLPMHIGSTLAQCPVAEDTGADGEAGPYIHKDTANSEGDSKRREKERVSEKKKEGSDKTKNVAEEAIDDTCPLYRCPGCDKLFVVRGLLSVADLKGLNVGNRRYVDSKTARAARDTHRRDAHPHLYADAQSTVSVQSPLRPLAHSEQTGDGKREPKLEGSTTAAAGVHAPDPAILCHGFAGQQNALGLKDPRPKDPRQRCGDDAGNTARAIADVAKRPTPTADFVPAPNGSREGMEGYVYKYGSSGPGYYRIVPSDTASASAPSARSHSTPVVASEQHSRVSNGVSDAGAGTSAVSGGKKTIAEVIQERTRQREEAEKERMKKEVEEKLRLEAEAKLREELRLMKEQLEQDRIQQQKQKEAEERERARRQQLEDERLRAELRAMKVQLDRQQRERELEWQQRRLQDSSSWPGKSPPRMPRVQSPRSRISMEDRMSARVPSPPSPRREFARRDQDDSDVEEGEIKEQSPPRPTISRSTISGTYREHTVQERRSATPPLSRARDASPSAHGAAANTAHQAAGAGAEQRDRDDSEHAGTASSCKDQSSVHWKSDANSIVRRQEVKKSARKGSKDAKPGKSKKGRAGAGAGGKAGKKCKKSFFSDDDDEEEEEDLAFNVNAGNIDEDREEGVDVDTLGDSDRACSPMLPSLRASGKHVAEQEEEEDDDTASVHNDDAEKRKSARASSRENTFYRELFDKATGAKRASGSKRKAPSGQGAAGKSKASKKAAMLKEFSRAELRAGEALLTLYDYYYTAAQQIEQAQELDGAASSAAQIGNNLLQKELQDAAAPRIQVGSRVKGKWNALRGGLIWYTGNITEVHDNETVDVMYDDGDIEPGVPLRFIQLLDKAGPALPNVTASVAKGGKRKISAAGGDNSLSKRRHLPTSIGNGTADGGQGDREVRGAGEAEMPRDSPLDGFLGTGNDDEEQDQPANGRGKKRGGTKGKSSGKGKSAGRGGAGVLRQSRARMVVQELPDAQPGKPLEECLLILDAVLSTKVAAALLSVDTRALFPLLVKSSVEVLGKNSEKTPMDFVSIRKHLSKTCQALSAAAASSSSQATGAASSAAGAKAAGHYRTAQQVREDVVRVMRLVHESWNTRQALRLCCAKVYEAFNELYEARISPLCYQTKSAIPSFPHGLHWLGQRVRVFWKDDFMWYNGCIDDHYGGDRYHIVYDDDGFEEWISLPSVSYLEKSRVVDVHMINVNWEQKSEQRLLQPGDAVLSLDTRAEELGAPAGIFYQAEVLNTRPSTRNASLRWCRGVWPLPDPGEEEVLSEDEEWMDVEQAKFVRCESNVSCHYLNGRVQAEEDETVRDIARRYNLEDVKLASLNKIEHPTITPTSRLVRGTLLLLPLHPTLAQRLPENALNSGAVAELPLPFLASSAAEGDEGNACISSEVGYLRDRTRGRYPETRRASRASRLLFGAKAVGAGASEKLLGARVAVECRNARLLGTVACYDAATLRYHILLDFHGGAEGLGCEAQQEVYVATALPCPDVHVVAARQPCPARKRGPGDDMASPDDMASTSSSALGTAQTAAGSSPDTPPVQAQHTKDADLHGTIGGVGAEQLAALVGMTVTRSFDGVSGKVSMLVPGSDVVMVEWEDGDCEDMHVADMQRQGLL